VNNNWDFDLSSAPRKRESSEDLYGDLPAYGSQRQQPASSSKIGSATYSRYSGRKQEDDLYDLQGSYFQTAFEDAYEKQDQVSIQHLPVQDPYADLYGDGGKDYLNANAYIDVFSNKNRRPAAPQQQAQPRPAAPVQANPYEMPSLKEPDVPSFLNQKPAERPEKAQREPAAYPQARPQRETAVYSQPAAYPQTPARREPTAEERERMERMRKAGAEALAEKGFDPEEAEEFMNTGRFNLKNAQQDLNENGVDKAFSAQQTARMAVIREAQKEAQLEQPRRGSKSNHSRPGYASDGKGEKTSKAGSFWKNVLEWVLMIALAAGIAFLLRTYIISFYKVDGPSMQPTLYTNERVLVNKIGYRTGEIQRFDVVICRYPGSSDFYVKRVIGMPGDVVRIDRGTVYVNDHELDEKYVVFSDTTSMMETTVQEGYYMVFGDNRADSTDSRSIGAISEDLIIGRVISVTWPMNKIKRVARIGEDEVMLEISKPEPTPVVVEPEPEATEAETQEGAETEEGTAETGEGTAETTDDQG